MGPRATSCIPGQLESLKGTLCKAAPLFSSLTSWYWLSVSTSTLSVMLLWKLHRNRNSSEGSGKPSVSETSTSVDWL